MSKRSDFIEQALAVTHPLTRVMKGDGNCGWRGEHSIGWQLGSEYLTLVAMAFGYLETLFTLRDPLRLQRELARIKSLNSLLDQVGQQEHLYEIFVDATEEIFLQISAAIQSGEQDETFLVNAFNNEYNSNAIITHFRVSFQDM